MAATNVNNIPRSHLLELIECSICTDIFTDPIELPCQHTFCLQCMESIAQTRSGSMPCPLCRRHFSVPREGLAGLPRDFKVQALVEVYNSVPTDRVDSKDNCRLHPTKRLDVYCFDCKSVTCPSCRQRSHISHKTSEFSQVAEDMRQRIAKEVAQLEQWSTEIAAKRAQLSERLVVFITEIESTEREIVKRSSELIQRIESHRHLLLVEIGILKKKKLEELDRTVKEFEEHSAILESFKSCYKSIKSNGSPMEICQAINELPLEVSEFQKQHLVQLERHIPAEGIVFWESDLTMFSKAKNVVGEIQVASPVNLDQSTMLTMPSSVIGVATIDGSIFVLCREPKSIYIYRGESPYLLEMKVDIFEIRDPWDMAASTPSNCLYVTDQFSECVWRISATKDIRSSGWLSRAVGDRVTRWWTGKDSPITRWLTGISYPYTISVSIDGLRVLMVRQGQPCCVDSYAQDGTRTQRLVLASDVENVRHAVETAEGNLVISHKWKTSGTWSVCEVNRDGQILRRFVAKNSRQQTLGEPFHLAVDSDHRVFVADYRNHRVIHFDSDLNWIRIVLTIDKDAIQEPSRLCCDRDKKRLLVGQTEGKLGLYSVSCK